MSFIRRVTATLSANIDQAISQIENHDAVIEAALRDTRDATARLKVERAKVRTETQRLRCEIAGLEEDERRWTERARRLGADDESRALICLRRRDDCRRKRDVLGRRLESAASLDERFAADLKRLEERLGEISARRQELRGREASAKAAGAIAELDRDFGLDTERAFERWEFEVTGREMVTTGVDPDHDDLEADLERDERDEALRAELADLLANREDQS